MKDHLLNQAPAHPALALYAKVVVLMTFVLILIGGHTTTSGAGMAFADWPLSNGSLNPEGWWQNFMMRLEHGHRLTAILVATLVAILFCWVSVSALITVFLRKETFPKTIFWLSFWAFLGVLTQAVLGGLRVLLDPQGTAPAAGGVATVFRVLHGCCAQLELCLLVALAAMLSPVWSRLNSQSASPGIGRFAWITAGVIFVQLIVGATMRHLGAGLAIPTFPLTPWGGFMPKVYNAPIDLNFTHTRFGAVLVAGFVISLVVKVLRHGGGDALLIRPALLSLGLLAFQVVLGMFVIWNLRPPMLTTLHVVNGAAVLAATVLLAVRASHECEGQALESVVDPELKEALA